MSIGRGVDNDVPDVIKGAPVAFEVVNIDLIIYGVEISRMSGER